MGELKLHSLDENDLHMIVVAFQEIGWNKPKSLYESYLLEQAQGLRSTFVANDKEAFCGYVTIKWKSDYPFFKRHNIPEIADLNVLPRFRKNGIGTALITACENVAKERGSNVIGIGVGITADYGDAQRLYVRLGYLPDGNGLHYKNKAVIFSENVSVDDDLVLYFTKEI